MRQQKINEFGELELVEMVKTQETKSSNHTQLTVENWLALKRKIRSIRNMLESYRQSYRGEPENKKRILKILLNLSDEFSEIITMYEETDLESISRRRLREHPPFLSVVQDCMNEMKKIRSDIRTAIDREL